MYQLKLRESTSTSIRTMLFSSPNTKESCDRDCSDQVERGPDEQWMAEALSEARLAVAADEVPIGAVVVLDGRLVARAHNLTRTRRDPTAHAEILALSAAARSCESMRLTGAVVYTTVEPCFMCAGALVHARVRRVVWAVRDPKFGGCVSLGFVLDAAGLNHRVEHAEGVRAAEARDLLVRFFQNKRAEARR